MNEIRFSIRGADEVEIKEVAQVIAESFFEPRVGYRVHVEIVTARPVEVIGQDIPLQWIAECRAVVVGAASISISDAVSE